jgi:3-deoxy-D-manno-octulosonate 8-phosphate phosphatase (KDO 8-P phosphatase)
MRKKSGTNFADIKLLVMDVDGVLTDGTVMINSDGNEGKLFNLQDGHGIRMWQRAGLKVAFLSGRFSQATELRAKQLEIDYCVQDCFEKLPEFKKLLEKTGFSVEETAYIGDDLLDLPVISCAGFGAAVTNAVDEVKQTADYVTTHSGGTGAVREVIEYILKKSGRWQELIERYLPDSETP